MSCLSGGDVLVVEGEGDERGGRERLLRLGKHLRLFILLWMGRLPEMKV